MADCDAILHLIEKGNTVIEIGVYKGKSSKEFLKRGAFCILIDPYESDSANPNVDIIMMNEVLERLYAYMGKFTMLKMKSSDAIDYVPEVDVVFIDGNHDYEFVKKDMDLYWKKVKPGGYMIGDDYSMGGVRRACDEFEKENNVKLETIGDRPLWMIRK